MVVVTVYVHADKDGMWDKGQQLGFQGEALRMFSFACVEVKLTLEVDEATGLARIVAVDDRKVET